jgi:CelD/BcsL family acetyltransferase involved in cellulose biosynthesis
VKVTLIPGRELGPDLFGRWRELQRSNLDLASPYFCPEFTQAIASVRDDVEVAVVEDEGSITAFLPFQRGHDSVGIPVGGIISDYQGLICAPEFACDPRELIKQCRLLAWDFDHLISAQRMFAPFHRYAESSPVMNLNAGFERYVAACHAARAERVKIRRLERVLGSVRLVVATTDKELLNQVLKWKSAHYLQTSSLDLFSIGWIRAAVERIHATQTPDFAGILSVLYAGGVTVAGHFGMRAGCVWHYWFPSYAPEYSRYSPGLVLLLKMAEDAAAVGLRTIDLGKGKMLYKDRFKNSEVPLAEGSVELLSMVKLRRQLHRTMRALTRPARQMVSSALRARGVHGSGK